MDGNIIYVGDNFISGVSDTFGARMHKHPLIEVYAACDGESHIVTEHNNVQGEILVVGPNVTHAISDAGKPGVAIFLDPLSELGYSLRQNTLGDSAVCVRNAEGELKKQLRILSEILVENSPAPSKSQNMENSPAPSKSQNVEISPAPSKSQNVEISSAGPTITAVSKENHGAISEALRQICETMLSQFTDGAGKRTCCNTSEVPRHLEQSSNLPYSETVLRAIEYLSDEDCDYEMDELAKYVFLSKSRLAHVFSEQTGITLKEYIQYKRLESACRKMLRGSNITEAAVDTGFSGSSHIATSSIKLTGMQLRKLLNI